MVAAYIPDGTDSNANVFASTDNTTNNKTVSTKYATVYFMADEKGWNINYAPNINRKFGDAVLEIAGGTPGWNNGWSNSDFPGRDYYNTADSPYFERGTGYSSSWNGIISYGRINGTTASGFRICFAI